LFWKNKFTITTNPKDAGRYANELEPARSAAAVPYLKINTLILNSKRDGFEVEKYL
jgi:hypothetical protein